MTEKLPFREPKRPRRRGKRLMVHFVLLTVLGVLLLGWGVYGRVQLHQIFDDRVTKNHMELLVTGTSDAVKTAAEASAEDTAQRRLISNGLSSKKRSAENAAKEGLAAGEKDEEALAVLYDALANAAVSRLDEGNEAQATLKERVAESLAGQREEILAGAIAAAEAATGGVTLGDIRRDVSRSEGHYASIYYSTVLLWTGAVCLILGLALGAVRFFGGEDFRQKVTDIVEPLDYLLPFFFGVAVFTLYPMVRVFIMAFQERYKLTGEFNGWGLGNFRDVLYGVNTKLPQAVGNTFIYVLVTVPVSTALSLVLAYLLNQKIKCRALFQTAYFLPMVTSATAVGLVWKFMFHEHYGVINWILSLFGGPKLAWLTNPAFSMAAMIIYGVWDSLPFTIILLISGLQNIDGHYYTVARVDGAKALRIFFRITVPLLSPTIGLVLIINSISAFKVFNSVVVLFSGRPGPTYNMYTMTYYIYEQINGNMEYGRAAAASLILFVFIFLFTMLQRLIQRKWTYN